MRIVLRENVPNLGRAGDVKDVADGYARNYLLPKKLAVLATKGTLKQTKLVVAAEEKREQQHLTEAQELADKLAGQTFTFYARAGETDRLYGSITSAQIAEAVGEALGQELDKDKVLLEQPIRELGEHAVQVELYGDVTAEITAVVVREE